MMWPWVAALAGMLGYGIGAIIQSASAKRHGGPTAMFRPLYLGGILCDALAWAGALVALQRLPLFTVQAILAGSLAVTVLLARIFLGTALARRDLIGISVAGLGLIIVAASSGVQSPSHAPPGFAWGMFAGIVVIAALTLWAYRRGVPLLLAALSGLAFSGGALGGRALGLTELSWSILANPILWLMAAYGVLAIFTFSRSLERGEVGSAMAVMWVVDVVVPGVIGVIVLGDTVRAGATVPAVIGVLISVVGCVLLAGTAAQPDRAAAEKEQVVPSGIS